MTIAYLSFFSAWLILTIFWQFSYCRENSKLLRRINFLHILPIWTFFAPRPGMSDTHIVYRDKLRSHQITGWTEVSLIDERNPFHWLWNPRKRLDKLAVDALSDVKFIKNRGTKDGSEDTAIQQQVKLSKGYLILLNIVFKQPKIEPESMWRQYAVLDATHTAGERTIAPIFFSPYHEFSE